MELGVCDGGKRVRLACATRCLNLFAQERRRARRTESPTSGTVMVAICYRVVDATKDGWDVCVYAQRHRSAMSGECSSSSRIRAYYTAISTGRSRFEYDSFEHPNLLRTAQFDMNVSWKR